MKPYNWRTDYDWTDPNDAPVGGSDEPIVDETEFMLPKDAGIKSLGKENTRVATSGPSHRISELIKRFNSGTITEEEKIELEMLIEMTPTMAQGGRIGYDNGGPGEIGGDNVSDILERVKELQDEGLDLGAAMAQAMKELSQGKAHGGRIRKAPGGIMDLGGMEKDYRTTGGFVPLGGRERADDVPARLSKNEFVFTADAVRSAGGGDIDAGAEVMENVMKNLEAGGEVSEDSQGLEGARGMFANAQQLEKRII